MVSRRTPVILWNLLRTRRAVPDLTFITDTLAVGGKVDSGQGGYLVELGIGSVVDLRSEAKDDEEEFRRLGIHYLYLPTIDWYPPSQEDLVRGSSWVLDEMEQGRKVLVHCQHGIGRSVILASCVLVRMGYDPYDALTLIKRRRWGAAPNEKQVAALLEFAAAWRGDGHERERSIRQQHS